MQAGRKAEPGHYCPRDQEAVGSGGPGSKSHKAFSLLICKPNLLPFSNALHLRDPNQERRSARLPRKGHQGRAGGEGSLAWLSSPAASICWLSQSHQASTAFWNHRPNLPNEESLQSLQAHLWGPPRHGTCHSLPPSVLTELPPCGRACPAPRALGRHGQDAGGGGKCRCRPFPCPVQPVSPALSPEGCSAGWFCSKTSQKEQCPSPGRSHSKQAPCWEPSRAEAAFLGTKEGCG